MLEPIVCEHLYLSTLSQTSDAKIQVVIIKRTGSALGALMPLIAAQAAASIAWESIAIALLQPTAAAAVPAWRREIG